MNTKIVTRFAPSPTGLLHTGTVRTALFAWAWARKHDGTFILRIEDTDKAREVEGGVQNIQDTLRFLGLDWDYGPNQPGPFGSCIQSERLPIYKKYAEKLVAMGRAYADPYSKEELDAFRKEADDFKIPFLYRTHRPSTTSVWDGTQALRFKTELKRYSWHDVTRGKLSAPEESLEDIILIKADGYPTYNFAHIVDDIEMSVTHVMRGEEFIASMPNFLAIYEALGHEPPIFVTLPPVLRTEGGKKLSKRAGAKSIVEFEKEGYVPEAIVNFLIFQGWNPGDEREIFTLDMFVKEFDISKIQKAGAKYNEDKLDWFNKEHIKQKSFEENKHRVLAYFDQEQISEVARVRLEKLAPTALTGLNTYADFYNAFRAGEYDYVLRAPVYESQSLIWKTDSREQAKKHLNHVHDLLSVATEEWQDSDRLKNVVWSYAEEQGRGSVLWPIRMALSGKDKSPDPFTLLFVLGKEESLIRIQNAISCLS